LTTVLIGKVAAVNQNNITCDACEFAFKEVAQEIPANYTLADLTNEMYKICAELKNFTSPCKLLVLTEAPKVFAAITGKASPLQTCQDIKACPKSATSHATAAAAAVPMSVEEREGSPIEKDGGYCQACEWAVKEATSLVPKNLTQAVFESDLEGVCALINKTATKIECIAAVKVVAPKIWPYLDGNKTSDAACTAAKLCPQLQPSNASCADCKNIFKEIAKSVPSNFTLKELTKDMYSACDHIKNFTGACKLLVVGLAPKLYDALTGTTPPAVVCDELKLCPHGADSARVTVFPTVAVKKKEQQHEEGVNMAPKTQTSNAIARRLAIAPY